MTPRTIGTRFSAIAVFVFNIVAVISYPDLSDAGIKDHMLWGALSHGGEIRCALQ